jgi:GNAT superfamily N-acetyltransferase
VNPHPFVLLSAPVKERDVAEIAELLRADPRVGHRRSAGEIAEHLDAAARVVRAVDQSGQLLGVGWVLSDGLGSGYVADVFVAEDHRRTGVGSAIVQHLGSALGTGRLSWLVGHEAGLVYAAL